MSGFDLIPSGILSGPDVTDSPDVRGVMTHYGSTAKQLPDYLQRSLARRLGVNHPQPCEMSDESRSGKS